MSKLISWIQTKLGFGIIMKQILKINDNIFILEKSLNELSKEIIRVEQVVIKLKEKIEKQEVNRKVDINTISSLQDDIDRYKKDIWGIQSDLSDLKILKQRYDEYWDKEFQYKNKYLICVANKEDLTDLKIIPGLYDNPSSAWKSIYEKGIQNNYKVYFSLQIHTSAKYETT